MTRVPEVGEIVFAPYEGDFYRGKVVKFDNKTQMVDVSFIDYGDATTVPLSVCKEPLDDIMKV